MLPEELDGFLDNHANTSLCRFVGICIVPLYVHEAMKGGGIPENIKTDDRRFLLDIHADEIRPPAAQVSSVASAMRMDRVSRHRPSKLGANRSAGAS